MSVGQPIRISFLPEFEGEAVRLENFFCRLGAEVSASLIRCSWAPEESAIPRPANPWDWLLAVPAKFNDAGSDAFSQIDKGVGTTLRQTMEDDQQLAAFQNAGIRELFDAHCSVYLAERPCFQGNTSFDYINSRCVKKRLTILRLRHASFARSTGSRYFVGVEQAFHGCFDELGG
jgi:hypothetical protein